MASTDDRRFGVDDNNNAAKYSLRPRSQRMAQETAEEQRKSGAEAAEERPQKPKRSRRDKQHPPLSKYRRKTANARERSRMREINEAFEALRRAVPRVQDEQGEKATKISTLRFAMEYITALHRALADSDGLPFMDSENRALRDPEGGFRALGDTKLAAMATKDYLGDAEGNIRTLRDSTEGFRALGDTKLLADVPSEDAYRVSGGGLARPSPTAGDFADLSLSTGDLSLSPTLETTDQSSSASDVSDLFLISLDLDPGPLRAFAALDHCLDDVLFNEGLS